MTVFAFRPATRADLVFVVDSWADSYRTAYGAGIAPMGELIDDEGVDRGYRANAGAWYRALLARPGVAVLVAYSPSADAELDIAGWLCTETGLVAPRQVAEGGRFATKWEDVGTVVHYVYVKALYRQAHRRLKVAPRGVARQLFDHVGVEPFSTGYAFTHKTSLAAKIVKAHLPFHQHGAWGERMNPLLCRFPKYDHPKPNPGEAP